jgi:hypothetical protein
MIRKASSMYEGGKITPATHYSNHSELIQNYRHRSARLHIINILRAKYTLWISSFKHPPDDKGTLNDPAMSCNSRVVYSLCLIDADAHLEKAWLPTFHSASSR